MVIRTHRYPIDHVRRRDVDVVAVGWRCRGRRSPLLHRGDRNESERERFSSESDNPADGYTVTFVPSNDVTENPLHRSF